MLKEKQIRSRENLCNRVVTFLKDEKAQSITLGFVIIMGIVLSASIIYFSMQIPDWTKDFEAEHASKVSQDFAKLVSVIDTATLSEEPTASGSCAIGMAPESVPFVGIHSAGGTLSFNHSERFECVAAAPGEIPPPGDIRHWSSTLDNFSYYDKFHVSISDRSNGAELELVKLKDKLYDSGDEIYLAGEYWFNNFTVTNGTTIRTSLLTIHAMNITIDSGSSINADGGGMSGGKKDRDGEGPGHGNSTTNFSAGGGGGGYGGNGGNGGDAIYYNNTHGHGGSGGLAYGNSSNQSVDAGSGGAGGACSREVGPGRCRYDGGNGGSGGGSIHLDAKTVIIAGTLSVNGEDGEDGSWAPDSAGGGGGGGSGGSIFIQGYNVSITGSGYLSAKGGDGGDGRSAWNQYSDIEENNGGGGGGGAGGRIKVFYNNTLDTPDNPANYVNISGGAGGAGGKHYWWAPGPDAEDGAAGNPGTYNTTQTLYNLTIPRYSSGYLISNVTAVKGHVGHDTGEAGDTSMISYGAISWTETKRPGTNIVMKVRTSTNASMIGAVDWKDCPEVMNGQDISDLSSVSDGHRYIQWRAELYTFERSRTPILHSVNISYEYGTPVLVNSSGSIVFGSQYLYLPNYKLVYAHGAIIKNQSKGEFMLHPPPISISKHDNVTMLIISSVNLTGSEKAASGVFSSSVKASYENAELLTGGLNFHNLTLNITTEYPTAWRNWFNETCEEADLEYTNTFAPGKYNINETGNTVQIIFYGNESKPVNLWLKRAEVEVGIEK